MKIYDVEGFPNPARVRIALTKKNAMDHPEFIPVDVLADQGYLAGDDFSMADITAFARMGFADFAKVDMPDGLDNLTSWRSRVGSRPSCI